MDKKYKELLEWEKKLKKEEEILSKSKRNLSERKQKLNEAEGKLKKKEKELQDMQKNIDAVRTNLDTKEKEVCALAKKLRDIAKVENNQELLKEYSDKNVFDVTKQESEVKLNERVGPFELKRLKNNVTDAATRLEKKNIFNEGDEDLGIFNRPPKTLTFEDYFPRHALE
ncbi:hypothetical protein K1719_031725 [Acacia pycnantha]|nr:hypothetical protein K1719_031725 [Acacia pycnantha]